MADKDKQHNDEYQFKERWNNLKKKFIEDVRTRYKAEGKSDAEVERLTQEYARQLDQPEFLKEELLKAIPSTWGEIAKLPVETQKSFAKEMAQLFRTGGEKRQTEEFDALALWRKGVFEQQKKIIDDAINARVGVDKAIADVAATGATLTGFLRILGMAFGKDEWVVAADIAEPKFRQMALDASDKIVAQQNLDLSDRLNPLPKEYNINYIDLDMNRDAQRILREAKDVFDPEVYKEFEEALIKSANKVGDHSRDIPQSPKKPKDGIFSPAGGPVKDHKADTVKPYSPADVRRYAAATLAPSKWDPTIAAAAEKISKETGISTSILAMEAKIRIGPESGGNPNAWNGGKGAKGEDAYGLMQLTPDTAKQYGVTNIKDPQQNIEGGLRFIAHIIKNYGRENVDLYYYGGEGKKDHGPNTRQYVENLGAVRTLLPKEGFEIAQASSEPKKEASRKQAAEKKETASVLPPFAAVAGLDNQIPGTDTRGLKTDAGALLARNDENKPKEGKVGDPSSTAQNDQRYRLLVGAPAPSGGFTGT